MLNHSCLEFLGRLSPVCYDTFENYIGIKHFFGKLFEGEELVGF